MKDYNGEGAYEMDDIIQRVKECAAELIKAAVARDTRVMQWCIDELQELQQNMIVNVIWAALPEEKRAELERQAELDLGND